MGYAATKPGTNSLYKAIVANNVNRLKGLLKNIGLSDSNFQEKSINEGSLSRLKFTISKVSQLSGHEEALKTFFDFVASAVDKETFLKRVGKKVSKDETEEKLPEDIRIVLKESDRERRISEQIEGLSRGQLVKLILFFASRKRSSLAIIDYKRFRAIIRAIRNTNLIPHCQLCYIMLGSLRT